MSHSFSSEYHKILCSDPPNFIDEYASLPILKRLSKVGLLCGTDWTPLFHNAFFYSRLEHSVGTALTVWNFTHSKEQTLAALLHDVSTPAFSHVADFMIGDALTQKSTEAINSRFIDENEELQSLLKRDKIQSSAVNDYHKYTVADNEIPGLSADRLEYMYPSGASLHGAWTIEEIEESYKNIVLLENEKGEKELGFLDAEVALKYTLKFIGTSLILQRNEDKVALSLLAEILSEAQRAGVISENDLYLLGEEELISRLTSVSKQEENKRLSHLFLAFRSIKKIVRSEKPIDGMFCVDVKVKKRYVNPLVKTETKNKRICEVKNKAKEAIANFLSYSDAKYGCVEIERREM